MRLILIFTVSLLCLPETGNACSCSPIPRAFCPSARQWDHVVMAEVTDSISRYERRIRIIENIRNAIALPDVILLGQDGVNCGERLEKLNFADTLILALHQETDTSYLLSWCGRNYLQYRNDTVSGPIYTETETTIPYPDFVADIDACLLYVSAKEARREPPSLRLYPNPCRNDLFVQMDGKDILNLKVYAANGKLLFDRQGAGLREIHLEMNGLEPGIYIACILYRGGMITRRVNKTW